MTMATRYGKTINGRSFHVCETTRMGMPMTTYFVDGKRVPATTYKAALAQAKDVEAHRKALAGAA